MKAVLISIQPKHCGNITLGIKKVEVRKTKPKIKTPFKVYIYETQGRTETPFVDEDGHEIFKGRGQVIGEFVCDDITKIKNHIFAFYAENKSNAETNAIANGSCLDFVDMKKYFGDKDGYAWHISDLVIYDKPKELREFYLACNKPSGTDCSVCIDHRENRCKSIIRPPQSWCYVEELKGE